MEKRKMSTTGKVVTQAELDSYSMSQLLNEFNGNTTTVGGTSIAKFSDRKAALRRTWASMQVAKEEATPALPPVTTTAESTDEPMVTCEVCKGLKAKSSCYFIAGQYMCKSGKDCAKPKGMKAQIQRATAVAVEKTEAKAQAKTVKVAKVKGQNPNIGKFDSCALVVLENKRANATSIRSSVYNFIADHKSCTIPEIVSAGVASLPVVRDCVKKLFADLKISISGWKVVTPRTLSFERIVEARSGEDRRKAA